ncbi:MAG: electron transfer flavoprotein alpha subunit [Solirubrobacteraceae bacterium]|jgi:electron transfer flavoprotein alpha subunit|nr:electron transfer flavoprotein alpha subunit [Solirubrobacteraceae bacterium]
MAALVFVEERDGELVAGSLGLLSKARDLGLEPVALLSGADVRRHADHLARYGATRVIVAEDPSLAGPLPQPRVDVVAAALQGGGFDTVLFENSALTADIAAALAARLEAGVNWDLVNLQIRDDELVGTRLALSDSAQVEVGWSGPMRLAVVRRDSFEPAEVADAAAPVEDLEVSVEERSGKVRIVERAEATATQGSIETAEILVAGGRGLGKKENLELLEQLAAALGGSVAVTMPLVDRGWYPYAHQVGQTGRTVKPRLYLACGISGAVQHRVGMQKSGTIVAINTDPTAPIFGVCDVGVVGDALEIVPRLTELVRNSNGG